MNGSRSQIPEVVFALTASTLMLAAHVAAKATRDTLFLSSFPATSLPPAMIAAALVSLVCAFVMSRLLMRTGPVKLIPLAFMLSGVLFAAEWFLVRARPGLGAVVVYMHNAVFGAVLISGFWLVVNEARPLRIRRSKVPNPFTATLPRA